MTTRRKKVRLRKRYNRLRRKLKTPSVRKRLANPLRAWALNWITQSSLTSASRGLDAEIMDSLFLGVP